MEYRKLAYAELVDEASERFGGHPSKWAFKCPICKAVATAGDFTAAGRPGAMVGQECIGRYVPGRGCNYAAYGLIPGPWEVILPATADRPERSIRSFPLAGAPAAQG